MRIGLRSGVAIFGLFLLVDAFCPQTAGAQDAARSSAPQAGANSFIESQARKRIEDSGFTDVSALVNDRLGVWTGVAKSGTNKVRVTVDYKGNVAATPE